MASDYALALGARLRAIRQQQALSLHGDRAVTVQKLAELAEFYSVPVAELLPDAPVAAAAEPPPKLILDLERLGQVPAEKAGPLARYSAAIQAQRGDYNGRVLSIRQDDLRTLAVIYDEVPSRLAEQLIAWGVLNPEARHAVD
jgi:transcriptional regulator with XRE-family HTH domain